MTIVKVRILAR